MSPTALVYALLVSLMYDAPRFLLKCWYDLELVATERVIKDNAVARADLKDALAYHTMLMNLSRLRQRPATADTLVYDF